jgi:mono/diheme cytochrome c family protein
VKPPGWNSPAAVGATALVALACAAVTIVGTRTDTPEAAAATASTGADLFRAKGCVGCHDGPEGADNPFELAPDLRLLPLVADRRVPGLDGRAYVEQSIREPQSFIVPGYDPDERVLMPALPLSPAEIQTLAAWLLPQPPRA